MSSTRGLTKPMGLEEFMCDSGARPSVKRKKHIREYIQNKKKVSDRASDVDSMSSPVKGVYVREVPDAVDEWLKEHPKKKYVKSKDIAPDVDIQKSYIAVALNHMDIECWSNSPGTGAIYINPYFISTQD